MGRIAGNDPGYTFRICRTAEIGGKRIAKATEHGFSLPSVSTFIGEVMGKPAGAMSWWGFRIGLAGVAKVLGEDPDAVVDAVGDAEALESLLKEHGVNPNAKTEEAGDRGSAAHEILELLADGERQQAVVAATAETANQGTAYGSAVISWWDEKVQPYIDSGEIRTVLSEVPVWSFRHLYVGTFDLALEWVRINDEGEVWQELGWEVLDLKTHKPARGFTKPGHGPAYVSDVTQIRAYRMAFEEMGERPDIFDGVGGPTFAQRVVVARENGKALEDSREVSPSFVQLLRAAYDQKTAFEKGAS